MTQRQIDNVIETTLLAKKINNQNYIRYSFYEINVKYPKEYGIMKQDLGMFLQQLRKRLKEELPEGLETLVGERGVKLSAGQKQRLNLIRGILIDKDLYFFDKPTSNLDVESEEKITNMIDKYLKEKIDKLIDLNLNGTISIEILREKKAKLQNKINKILYLRNLLVSKKSKNKIKRVDNHKIKATIEVDMVLGVV